MHTFAVSRLSQQKLAIESRGRKDPRPQHGPERFAEQEADGSRSQEIQNTGEAISAFHFPNFRFPECQRFSISVFATQSRSP